MANGKPWRTRPLTAAERQLVRLLPNDRPLGQGLRRYTVRQAVATDADVADAEITTHDVCWADADDRTLPRLPARADCVGCVSPTCFGVVYCPALKTIIAGARCKRIKARPFYWRHDYFRARLLTDSTGVEPQATPVDKPANGVARTATVQATERKDKEAIERKRQAERQLLGLDERSVGKRGAAIWEQSTITSGSGDANTLKRLA